MVSIVADASDVITTTTQTFNDTDAWKYTVPAGKYLRIQQISLAVDGTFSSGKGKALVKLRNQVITLNSGAPTAGGITLLANLTFDFSQAGVLVLLGSGEQIEVYYRSTDGTSVSAQAEMTGYLIDEREAQEQIRMARGRGELVFGSVF